MINRKIISLTSSLIKLKTTSQNRHQIKVALNIIKEALNQSSISSRSLNNKGSHLLWTTNKNFNSPDILILCHIDVVRGSHDQFSPKIIKGKIFGRGSFDMKGPTSAVISSFTQLDSQKNVQVLITSDEETGGKLGTQWFFKKNKNYS